MNDFPTTPEMQDLSDQIGEFVYYWGFKRIHGKIWTHLFLSKKPLDAADLVRQMSISKALVSISLRELMEYDVIQLAGKSARGTQLYRTNPDILSVILSVLRQREKRMRSRIQASHESMQRMAPVEHARIGVSETRLKQLGELVQKAALGLEGIITLRPVDFGQWHSAFAIADVEEEESTEDAAMTETASEQNLALEGSPDASSDDLNDMTTDDRLKSSLATTVSAVSMNPKQS